MLLCAGSENRTLYCKRVDYGFSPADAGQRKRSTLTKTLTDPLPRRPRGSYSGNDEQLASSFNSSTAWLAQISGGWIDTFDVTLRCEDAVGCRGPAVKEEHSTTLLQNWRWAWQCSLTAASCESRESRYKPTHNRSYFTSLSPSSGTDSLSVSLPISSPFANCVPLATSPLLLSLRDPSLLLRCDFLHYCH
eukprot:scpid49556/ scgid33424/ 